VSAATYHVCADGRSVLELACRPGTLHSSAAPPEGWTAPPHPFIHGVATDPLHEHRLGTLLRESADALDFLRRAIAAGYDVVSGALDRWDLEGPSRRIVHGAAVLGCVWRMAGPFATLALEAPATLFVSPHALVTAYDDTAAPAIEAALHECADADDFVTRLEAHRWKLDRPLP